MVLVKTVLHMKGLRKMENNVGLINVHHQRFFQLMEPVQNVQIIKRHKVVVRNVVQIHALLNRNYLQMAHVKIVLSIQDRMRTVNNVYKISVMVTKYLTWMGHVKIVHKTLQSLITNALKISLTRYHLAKIKPFRQLRVQSRFSHYLVESRFLQKQPSMTSSLILIPKIVPLRHQNQ